MHVTHLKSEPMDVNVYVVRDGDEAMVVDTGLGQDLDRLFAAVEKAAAGARVAKLFLTHPHADHVAAARAFHDRFGCEVLIHAPDAPIIEKGDASGTLGGYLGVGQAPCPVTPVPTHGKVAVGATTFEVLEFPGHTPHHGALWHAASGTLFSGDVVFEFGSFGRVDFPGGSGEALVESLQRISEMPVKRVYPGHMGAILEDAQDAVLTALANAEAMLL